MREHDYDLVGDVNGQDIKLVFKKLKGGTAVGVDGIPIMDSLLNVVYLCTSNMFLFDLS